MRIGLVVSGGDSTGINNFIFQIANLARAEIVIFNGGIQGLLENNNQHISYRDMLDFSVSSMPIISSGRTEKLLTDDEYQVVVGNLKTKRINTLIMAGGDGSLQFLKVLSGFGVNCFGVGMTIDNDINGSEYTIGFATACEQVLKEVIKLRNTGRGLPNRVFMVELLGARCGELTLQSAIKSNADFALIPESQISVNDLALKVTEKLKVQNSVIILCSEGYTNEYESGFQGAINTVVPLLEPLIDVRIRKAIMGFSLRNGDPTSEEIYQGTSMANEIVRCIRSGMQNKVIVINSNNKPIPIDLISMGHRTVDINGHYFKLGKELGII